MLDWLTKNAIANLGATLDKTVKTGTDELRDKLDKNISTASQEIAKNVNHVGDRFDLAVAKAEESLKSTIERASGELEKNIKLLSSEIHNHRSLTKEDVIQLIDHANMRFNDTIEKRVSEIRSQTSALIDEKVSTIRRSLSEAAEEQKRAFLRNATIAVGSAIVVALVSIVAKKLSNTPFDALTVFRIVLGMFAAGGAASLAYRIFLRYKSRASMERDAIKLVLHDVRILNPKGVGFQTTVLIVAVAFWLVLLLKPALVGL